MDVSPDLPEDAVCDFSLHRPTSEPFERFVAIADRPLRWTSASDGHWITLEEATTLEVLADPERFSSECIIIPRRAKVWPRRLIPEEIDPPDHAEYRRLVGPAFSPPAIAAHGEALSRIVAELVAGLTPGATVDLMTVFARPVGVRSWALVVGFDGNETNALTDAQHRLSSRDLDEQQAGAAALVGALEGVIADRREDPRDDVPSLIILGEIDGRVISQEQALDYLFLLALAGIDTVASVLGYLLRELARDPSLHDRIAAEPECRSGVVEETLRRFSIVNTARTATRDTEIAGQPIRAGDRILVPTCAVSLDPALYDDPLAFDIDRPPHRHLAFGVGPHRCLGSHLARAILGAVLDRIGIVRFEPTEDLGPYATGGLVHGMAGLPVTVGAPG